MYSFSALLARMKFINRWGLMRQLRTENLAEHSIETAQIAHILGVIAIKEYSRDDVRPELLATAALYHDISEILTGDMPTPVKYQNDQLKSQYKKLEKESVIRLCSLLPNDIGQYIQPIALQEVLNDYEKSLLKAADKLSALIKCIEECSGGNKDFESALKAQEKALLAMRLPELEYFNKYMLNTYSKNLDELTLN